MTNAVNGGVATALLATPWWVDVLHAVSNTLSFVSVACGAVIGIHTVYRIIKGKR